MESKTTDKQALATYLLALAILQGNGRTYVNHEIMDALERLQKEFNLN